ncbi:hypothetical protein [Ferrovibrio sp.]|uniref:hypothetical protein n=1 Tax=Ferrovibrio sp. TaxID=1917215 RepID=UPI0025B7C63B|nr:hypothetical protein [Ferrovibrio sp.]MBX3455903.1 hypothetical protein [Ferrovibrio sp.]
MILRATPYILALMLLGAADAGLTPACAQAAGNSKKNTNCYNAKEVEAEAEVRAGLGLRDTLRRCARVSEDGQAALDAWYAFDKDNTDRIKGAVTMRHNTIKRLYPKRTAQEQWENDASIATRAAPEINDGVCKAAYDVIDKLKKNGWPAFKYYAKLQQSLLVTDIPICREN